MSNPSIPLSDNPPPTQVLSSPGAPPAVCDASLVAALRAEQRTAWEQGDRVRAEVYLVRHPELAADVEKALDLVYGEFLLREELGEAPTLEEYRQRFPQFAEPLRRQLEVHLGIDEPGGSQPAQTPPPKSSLRPPASAPAANAGKTGSGTDLLSVLSECRLLEPQQLSELSNIAPAERVEPQALGDALLRRGWLTRYQVDQLLSGQASQLALGQYVLLELLGEGGMGQVFKARHRLMRRVVALKVIRKEQLGDDDAVARFHREIRALAALSHPNIVLAHDADQVDDTHFFVMEYVEGIDLSKLMQCRGPLPVGEACECIRQAALGLQHAHARGLIHRDIKPSNLLLTAEAADGDGAGGTVKLLDLGLARRREDLGGTQSAALTQSGTIMGTPDYMAPEQAADSHEVDGRADIYSLGGSLYYLLSGRPPFPTGSALDKLIQHKTEEPTPIEKLRRDVPAAVARVLRRMMAKKPTDRFPTAAEVAAALAPFARPVQPAARWVPGKGNDNAPASPTPWVAGREPATVTGTPLPPSRLAGRRRRALPLLGLAPLAVLLGLGIAWLIASLGNQTSESEGGAPPTGGELAPVARVSTPFTPPAVPTAPKETPAVPPPPKEPPVIKPPPEPPALVRRLQNHEHPVRSVAFDPRPEAGRAFSCGGYVLLEWDLNGRRLQRTVVERDQLIWSVACSFNGRYAVCGTGGYLPEDTPKGTEGLPASDNFVLLLDLQGGGRVVGNFDRLDRDPEDGKPRKGHDDAVLSVALSPSADRVASGGHDKMVRLWDLERRKELRTYAGHADRVSCVAFPRFSEKLLASGDLGGTVYVWDVGDAGSRKPKYQLRGYKGAVLGLAFARDGKRLASAHADGMVRVWDVAEERVIGTFKGHGGEPVYAVTFVDDERVLSGGGDGMVRLWSSNDFQEIKPFPGHTKAVRTVAVSGDGKYALSGGDDRDVILWALPPPANP